MGRRKGSGCREVAKPTRKSERLGNKCLSPPPEKKKCLSAPPAKKAASATTKQVEVEAKDSTVKDETDCKSNLAENGEKKPAELPEAKQPDNNNEAENNVEPK